MTANSTVFQSVAVADPSSPTHVIKPNADGSINITGSISATSAATATAAAPVYAEGVSEPLSQDLSGALRVLATFPASLAVTNAGTFAVQASQTGNWDIRNITGTVVLPTGAATSALQSTGNTALTTINTTLGSPFQAGGSIGNTTFAVTNAGTFAVQAAQSGTWNITNVSGTVSLPTGASTAAKQPALGTAGSASADVLTIQGIASMTKLLVTPDSVALPANQSVNVSQMNGVTVTMGNGTAGTGVQRVTIASDSTGIIAAAGQTAAAASLTVNPLTIGGRAATANPTAVTDGQVVNTMHDKVGKLVAVGAIRILKGSQQTSISNTTSETTIVTAVSATFLDLYGLILANTGATTTKVSIRDTTAGTVIAVIEVPTLETRGFTVTVDSAIPQTTVNTNWTATCASATTALEVTALYVKNT